MEGLHFDRGEAVTDQATKDLAMIHYRNAYSSIGKRIDEIFIYFLSSEAREPCGQFAGNKLGFNHKRETDIILLLDKSLLVIGHHAQLFAGGNTGGFGGRCLLFHLEMK